jgi:polyhydroxyalkanoate synthase subunit PhaE
MDFQNNNKVVDTLLETQKKVVDTVVENTKKFTNGNTILNETIEKGSDWYKKWLEDQKTMFSKVSSQVADTTETVKNKAAEAVKDSTTKMNEFYENWMNNQANWAKQVWEMSQENAKKFGAEASNNPFASWTGAANSNPFASWTGASANANPWANWTNASANPFMSGMNNASNPWANWMNQVNMNNWMNQMQGMNPFNADSFKKANDGMGTLYNQYSNFLNNNFSEWQKNFQNGTVQDAYKNMMSSGEGFTKFAEMWTPMFKSIQDNTFNMETYKKFMNPELYKDFMDKFFGFLPESSRKQMQDMTSRMNEGVKQMSNNAMGGYQQMRDMMSKMSNGSEVFGNMQQAYTNWYNQMNEAAAPFTKMITPNEHTKNMKEWAGIANLITQYNIKNSELQYMIYAQGVKVMDKLAENTAKKTQDGTEVTSMLALYQEWLNIGDKVYVSLFESKEYSELMAEVSALQMKVRKDLEMQMEKAFKDVPVATRSEMDEVYKTIHDLKTQIRQLEKMMELGSEEAAEEVAEEKPTTAKRGKK